MELPLDEIAVGDRVRKELGDMDSLVASVKKFGILEPVVVSADRELMAGARRLTAARLAGLATVPAYVVPADDELTRREIELEENERRKGFTLGERVEAAKAIERLIAEGKKSVPDGTRRRDYVAGAVGFESGATLGRAKQVMANGSDALKDAVDKGAVSVGAAADLLTLPKAEQERVVKAGTAKEAAAEVREKKKGQAASKPKKPAEPVKQEKTADDGDTVLLDGLGNPVPNCVADAFGDPALLSVVKMVEEQLASLRSLLAAVKDVTRKGDAWPFAHFGKAMVSLSNAIDNVRETHGQVNVGMPFCVCQNCKGNGCPLCGSAGYQTRHMYENPDQYGGD